MRLSAEQQRLVTSNTGIAYAVLAKLRIHGAGFEEARCEAMLALCLAAGSYNPDRGQFSTWAWVKIRWHLATWLTKTNQAQPMAIADAESPSPDASSPESTLGATQVDELISEALSDGTDLTRAVARLAMAGLTKEEIARELGVSVSTAARRRRDAKDLLADIAILCRTDNL